MGCLIEKALTTPDQYPMSLNSLLAACNQKSNRDPVMTLDEEAVFDSLQALRGRGWVMMVMPSSGRVERWKRQVRDRLGIDTLQEAVLAELMLRGPQTAAELRSRCARMKPFESLEAMQNVLESMMKPVAAGDGEVGRDALVRRIPAAPGERAERWAQTLAPQAHAVAAAAGRAGEVSRGGGSSAGDVGGIGARIASGGDGDVTRFGSRMTEIEIRVASVERDVEAIKRELGM